MFVQTIDDQDRGPGALEAQAAAHEPAENATRAAQRGHTPRKKQAAGKASNTTSSATSGATSGDDAPLTKLSVEELQQRYVEVIQRPTSSSSKA